MLAEDPADLVETMLRKIFDEVGGTAAAAAGRMTTSAPRVSRGCGGECAAPPKCSCGASTSCSLRSIATATRARPVATGTSPDSGSTTSNRRTSAGLAPASRPHQGAPRAGGVEAMKPILRPLGVSLLLAVTGCDGGSRTLESAPPRSATWRAFRRRCGVLPAGARPTAAFPGLFAGLASRAKRSLSECWQSIRGSRSRGRRSRRRPTRRDSPARQLCGARGDGLRPPRGRAGEPGCRGSARGRADVEQRAY